MRGRLEREVTFDEDAISSSVAKSGSDCDCTDVKTGEAGGVRCTLGILRIYFLTASG
jgi:hypothetical protein